MHRVVHSITDGDLGEPFRSATVVSFPDVAALIRKTQDFSARRGASSSNNTAEKAAKIQNDALKHAALIEQSSASSRVFRRLLVLKCRRRRDQNIGMNAHLLNVQVDDEGNVIPNSNSDHAPSDNGQGEAETATMMPFEALQLATLVPQSVDEALAYLPTLRRFELADVNEAVKMVIEDGLS